MPIKISIIGGGGRVGSNAAYALQLGGIVRGIHLVDANEDLAQGEALDLLHGSSIAADQLITAGPASQAADADVVCITAGSRRKPDESRLDLINRNVSIFKSILEELRTSRLDKNAIIFVVSNPVDILTRLAIEHLGWDPARVMGLGTVLDTARFRSLIAAEMKLPPTQVKAMILGEHGDSMFPAWSTATVAGMSLTKMMDVSKQIDLFKRTQGSGAEVIRRKGGAGYAVGVSIAEVIHAIALDRGAILPVSTRMNGHHGLKGTCLSLPTTVGRGGVVHAHEVELWPKEASSLRASAAALDETWKSLA